MFSHYENVRTLALHRITAAEALYEPIRRKAGFSVDGFIALDELGVRTGRPIVLKVLFTKQAGEHLFETKLHADQHLTPTDDGRLELLAKVPNTKEVLWWLLGFGDGVEVLAPESLRRQIGDTAAGMAKIYRARERKPKR